MGNLARWGRFTFTSFSPKSFSLSRLDRDLPALTQEKGKMGNLLDKPKDDKDSHELVTSEGIKVACSGMQGYRLEMEDAHILQKMPTKPTHTLLSIFDGHGGSGAAIFAGQKLIQLIEDTPEWKEYAANPNSDDPEMVGKAMVKAYFECDRTLRHFQDTDANADTSGCTAVSCMLTPKYVICVNAGDSRAVIGSSGIAIPLSEDHKPQDELERMRIEKAGGIVQAKRVDGDLAVSRAFGDFQYKTRPDLPPEEQKVSCEPDVRIHTRTPADDILLVACDGLWDVFSNSEAIDCAREVLLEGETDPVKIVEEMLDISLLKGSRDNISGIVALLPGCMFGAASGGGVDKRRKEREERRLAEQEKNQE